MNAPDRALLTFASSSATRSKPFPLSFAGRGFYPIHRLSDEFSEYETYSVLGWDGYEAEPVLSATIAAARLFFQARPLSIARPDIAPGADGTIGFEWRFASGDYRAFVMVDIGPGDRVDARLVRNDGTIERLPQMKFAPETWPYLSLWFK